MSVRGLTRHGTCINGWFLARQKLGMKQQGLIRQETGVNGCGLTRQGIGVNGCCLMRESICE